MARHPRRDAEIQQTQARILRAAARAFARKGYQATTMAEIAGEAGYTPPTLYNYFKGKREIFDELVASVLGEFLQTFEERQPAGLSFAQRLELLLMRQFEIVDRRSDAIAFFVTAAHGPGGKPVDDDGDADAHKNAYYDRLAAWIADNTRGTDLETADPAILATFIEGTTTAFTSRWVTGGRHRPAADLVPTVHALIVGGVVGLRDRRRSAS